jgi:hypothetical protein
MASFPDRDPCGRYPAKPTPLTSVSQSRGLSDYPKRGRLQTRKMLVTPRSRVARSDAV